MVQNIKNVQIFLFEYIIFNLINNYEIHEILQNELKIYINENTKFTYFGVFDQFDYQILDIPGTKQCFSELRSIYCGVFMNNNVITELLGVCKTVSKLELLVNDAYNTNYDVIKLIDMSENLTKVILSDNYNRDYSAEILFHKNLETTQTITNILSSFINLKELELDCGRYCSWNCLENLCLPFFTNFKKLASLIENTSDYLNEISIEFSLPEEINNKRIIQVIYKKCPKLKYLKSIL
ncbi:hypothetical protein C1646_756089 [Rhizophagus diaphanus]|nr:hypothetical protein C1646_756089 [Rhizophagus diaphanus] [Rhizophagus sp. MUCL 43196]